MGEAMYQGTAIFFAACSARVAKRGAMNPLWARAGGGWQKLQLESSVSDCGAMEKQARVARTPLRVWRLATAPVELREGEMPLPSFRLAAGGRTASTVFSVSVRSVEGEGPSSIFPVGPFDFSSQHRGTSIGQVGAFDPCSGRLGEGKFPVAIQ